VATADQSRPQAEIIGEATMDKDGTVVVWLRASGPGGVTGHGALRYPPSHPEYANVLAHIGGLKPGEKKPFPPWS
jgi:hypothetical protein